MMARMQTKDDHRHFWERRLAHDWDEAGVGYRALGRPFNNWMYRVRREVFLRQARSLRLDQRTRVLDIGSGTGMYLGWWRRAGAGVVIGSDRADSAVQQMRAHRSERVERLDISAGIGPFEEGSFDVVSCMDVLFHITDDEQYLAALSNASRLLRPGGHFVFSENFLHRRADRTAHQVNRSLTWITDALRERDLVIERRAPMLVLMNAQVDAPKVWRKLWGGALRAVTLTAPTGWLAGAALYPVERTLTRWLPESPTTEMAICTRQ